MSAESSKPYVLILDDDKASRQKLSTFCKNAGCRVDVSDDVHSTVAALDAVDYDVIVSDYHLPEISGQDILSAVRNNEHGCAIILLSHTYSADDAVAAIKLGASDFLQKPVDYDTFQDSISKALSVSRSLKEHHSYDEHITECHYKYEFQTKELIDNHLARHIITHARESGLFGHDVALQMQLVFQEALANAVEHGNLELASEWKEEIDDDGLDKFTLKKRERLADDTYADRKVIVELGFSRCELYFRIVNEGPGFLVDEKKTIKKTDDLKSYGRGILIMMKTMDEVNYSDSGREVVLKKKF